MDVLLALLPILTLIVLMGVFKVPGDRSSLITLIVTIVIAVTGSHTADHPYGHLQLQRTPAHRED